MNNPGKSIDDRILEFRQSMSYHRPDEETQEVMEQVREAASDFGIDLMTNIPNCPELTLALRKIEEASMWAIKALALNGNLA